MNTFTVVTVGMGEYYEATEVLQKNKRLDSNATKEDISFLLARASCISQHWIYGHLLPR
jgi:hypothetical protein